MDNHGMTTHIPTKSEVKQWVREVLEEGKKATTHIERMKAEHDQLLDKVQKLQAFFETDTYAELDLLEQKLMHEQAQHMYAYLLTLRRRYRIANPDDTLFPTA